MICDNRDCKHYLLYELMIDNNQFVLAPCNDCIVYKKYLPDEKKHNNKNENINLNNATIVDLVNELRKRGVLKSVDSIVV